MHLSDVVAMLKSLVHELLVAIPISAGIAFFYWFFAEVVLGLSITETPFLTAWRWTYIILALAVMAFSILYTITLSIRIAYLMQRFNANKKEVREALFEHKFGRIKGCRNWTAEEFRRKLKFARANRDATLRTFGRRRL